MKIDTSSPVPASTQVEQLIEQLILQRNLAAHELLPGVTLLARKLGVAPLTVQKAYRRLQERGLIYSVTGKGTFVAEASKLQYVGILVHQRYMLETAAAPTHALLIHAFCQHLAALRLPVRILTDTGPISRTNASISGDVMSALEQGRPLGLITLGHYGTPSLYELARSRSFPVVGVGVASKQPTVRLNYDHFAIVRAAMIRFALFSRARVRRLFGSAALEVLA